MKVIILVVQEKELSIPHEELGRSIATVQVLQRKHEAFERELTALGNKVLHVESYHNYSLTARHSTITPCSRRCVHECVFRTLLDYGTGL